MACSSQAPPTHAECCLPPPSSAAGIIATVTSNAYYLAGVILGIYGGLFNVIWREYRVLFARTWELLTGTRKTPEQVVSELPRTTEEVRAAGTYHLVDCAWCQGEIELGCEPRIVRAVSMYGVALSRLARQQPRGTAMQS